MTEDYCKLASGIILSTIWQEDDHTRILWVTMLALKSRDHRVLASIPGLASVANIPVESCRAALTKLMSPDPDSRTTENEGRRIVAIDGGWLIVNGEKYRNYLSKQERNEYQAKLMAKRRAKEDDSDVSTALAPVSTKLAVLGQAEAEAEKKRPSDVGAKESPPTAKVLKFPNGLTDSEWLARLAADPTYSGIDVDREHGKMLTWCTANNKAATRRRFVNWLNRTERPMFAAGFKRQSGASMSQEQLDRIPTITV